MNCLKRFVISLSIIFIISATSFALEHSYKLYGIGGTGFSAIGSYGGGFSYAFYAKPKSLLHTFDVNLFALGVQDYEHDKKFGIKDPDFQVNIFVGYGLGFVTGNGTKITFDIIGLGVNVTTRDDTIFNSGSRYTKIGTLANAIGVQVVMQNGLYIGWRNTFTGYNYRTREDYRKATVIADAGEFKTLFMIGYDFGTLVKK